MYRRLTHLSALISLLAAGNALAKGEITQVVTQPEAAIPLEYVIGGQTHNWGAGSDLRLQSVEINGQSLEYNAITPDKVIVRRVSNNHAAGKPCALFVTTVDGNEYSYAPSYPAEIADEPGNCDYGKLISSNRVNIGSLDLFSNAIREHSLKNIERVDLVFSNGITTPTVGLDSAGHVVLEKSGNNHIQLAAITKLDADGNPSEYGRLVMVRPHDYEDDTEIRYGITNIPAERYAYLANENKAPQGRVHFKRLAQTSESMGAAFVSVADLGLDAGQTYYGISLFAADVNANDHTLTDPTTFPLDTAVSKPVTTVDGDPASNAGDADVIVGTVGDFTIPNTNSGNGGDAGSNGGSNVAGDSETVDVTDVVESSSASSGGGGAAGLLFALLAPLAIRRRIRNG